IQAAAESGSALSLVAGLLPPGRGTTAYMPRRNTEIPIYPESAIRPTSRRHAPMLDAPGMERIMRNEIEHAWQKAADCAARAQGASDPNIREFFIRLRDSWIGAANRAEFIADMDQYLDASSAAVRESLTLDSHPKTNSGLIGLGLSTPRAPWRISRRRIATQPIGRDHAAANNPPGFPSE